MRRAAFALFAALVCGAGVVGATEERRSFDAWSVTCDAFDYCTASASASGNAALAIARHAQEIYWELSFTPAGGAAGVQRLTVTVDGQVTVFTGAAEVAGYGSADRYYLLGDKAQQVLDQLVPAAEARIAMDDGGGPMQFSLKGLAAALIFIDEHQRRLGSERVAEAPPVGLEPVRAEHVATTEIPDDLRERRRAEQDCAALDDLANASDFESGTVGEGDVATTIYVVPCNAGAYNFSSAIYSGTEGNYTRHAFAEFWPSIGWSGTSELFGADLDPAAGTISTFYKSRGLGDCGSTAVYKWADSGFRLEEFRAKEACDERVGDFPLVYSYAPPSGSKQPRARSAQ